jgi:hypothetical protein
VKRCREEALTVPPNFGAGFQTCRKLFQKKVLRLALEMLERTLNRLVSFEALMFKHPVP